MYIYFIHKRGCFPWDFASILFSPPITLWYSSVFHDRLTANLTIWQLLEPVRDTSRCVFMAFVKKSKTKSSVVFWDSRYL